MLTHKRKHNNYIIITKLKRNLSKFAAALRCRHSGCWNHSNYVSKLKFYTVATK